MSSVSDAFEYDPLTGRLSWAIKRGTRKRGDPVDSKSKGYLRVKFKGKHYKAHNICWYLMTGEWPDNFTVDHINRDGLDNRWANLRKADRSQQQANGRGWGESQYKGVCRRKGTSRWVAYCNRKQLGTFNTEVEAAKAYNKAAKDLWGDRAFLNEV
jgi:hypothetical protein